mgnify:CR=1 FL=1
MSFLVSLATGFLNESTEIMRNQAEFDREQAEKATLKKQELAKENRAFNREVIKKNLDASFATQKQYLKDVASGNIKPVKIKTEGGMLTAMDMFKINQSYISQGKAPIYNVPSLYERIEKVEKFGTMIGKGTNAFNYPSEYQTKPNSQNAFSLLQQIGGSTGLSESELARLKAAPDAVKANMKSIINGATVAFNDGYHKMYYGEFDPKETTQKYPRDSYYNKGAVFDGINQIKKVLGMPIGEPNKIVENVDSVASQKSTEDSTGTKEKFQTYAVVPTGTNGDKSGIGYSYSQEEQAAVPIVARLHPKKDFKYAMQSFLESRDIQDLTISNENKINLFHRTMKVASMQGARGLDPNRSLLKYNREEIIKFNNAIYDGKVVKQGNIRLAGAVLMPIMEVPDEDVKKSYEDSRIEYTGSQYMSFQRFGDIAKSDKTKRELGVRVENLRTSVGNLRRLQTDVATLNTTDAFNKLREFAIGVFGEKGFVSNIITEFSKTSDIKVGGVYDLGNGETRQALTQEYIKGLQDNINSKTGIAAQIEATRISLAFQMARAADPSGRLSNQDIDLQLRRLGGAAFASPEFAIRQIQTVLDDFERELQTIEIFHKYGQNTSRLTKNEARYIDGVIAANYVNKKMQEYNNPITGGGGSSSPEVGVVTLSADEGYKKTQMYTGVYLKGMSYYRQTGTTDDGKPIGVIIPENKEQEILPRLRIKPEGAS